MVRSLVFILIIITTLPAKGQQTSSTQQLAGDFKRLRELNSSQENVVDLSRNEAINISENATVDQLITITTPYLNSPVLNTKQLCIQFLNKVLFYKKATPSQRQQVAELLCKNFLDSTSDDFESAYNTLVMLKANDFTAAAKKHIADLVKDGAPRFEYAHCAKLMAVAQIRQSIPLLWKIANSDIATMGRSDLDVLASLARLDEREAAILLCNYYNQARNDTDYKQIFLAERLAFSLHKTVLDCLVNDFRSIDPAIQFWHGDAGYWPSQHLANHIASMLKNYPENERPFPDVKALAQWLDQTQVYELREK